MARRTRIGTRPGWLGRVVVDARWLQLLIVSPAQHQVVNLT